MERLDSFPDHDEMDCHAKFVGDASKEILMPCWESVCDTVER